MRYDVADFTKVIDIVYIIILHAVEKNFCNLPSSFKVQTYVKTVSVLGRLELTCRDTVWVTFTTDSNPKIRSYR